MVEHLVGPSDEKKPHTDVCYCRKLLSLKAKPSPSAAGRPLQRDREEKEGNFVQRKNKEIKKGRKGRKKKKNREEKKLKREAFTLKGLPLGLWSVQWVGSVPAPPSWCQSTQCCPGGSLRRGMKVWPSSRGFSQKAPSPRTLRWMTRCCRSPWGIRSYTSWGGRRG